MTASAMFEVLIIVSTGGKTTVPKSSGCSAINSLLQRVPHPTRFRMRSVAGAESRKNINALTGLRGFAATAVVVHHCWLWSVGGSTARGGVPGQWAVDLFFALSGFVLSLNYLDGPISWRRFAVARFARIYPLHIATALAMALILLVKWKTGVTHRDPSLTIGQTVREFGMLTAMPVIGRNMIWNDPSWSISVEAWTYILLFPLIVIVPRGFPMRWIVAFVFIMLVALTLAMYCLPAGAPPNRGWIALARAMIEFAGGWVAYLICTTGRSPIGSIQTDLIMMATLGVLASVPLINIEPWVLIPVFPLLVAGIAAGGSVTSRVFAQPALLYLGEISFSIYLMHPFVLMAVQPVLLNFKVEHVFTLWVAVVVPASIAVSAVTYRFIEKLSRNWIRGWLN